MAQDNGPAQINTPSQYPTATKIDNGVAYDITGKALGPVDEGQVAQSQQSDPWGVSAVVDTPQAAAKPEKDPWGVADDQWGVSEQQPEEDKGVWAGVKRNTVGLVSGLYHAFADEATDQEKKDLMKKYSEEVVKEKSAGRSGETPELEKLKKETQNPSMATLAWHRLVDAPADQLSDKANTELGSANELWQNKQYWKGANTAVSGAIDKLLSEVPLAGPMINGIAERAESGDVSGAVTDMASLIAMEHAPTAIKAGLRSTRVALEGASKASQAAETVHAQALQDSGTAVRQAEDAAHQAAQTRDQFGVDPNVTRQHVVDAENRASLAAANAQRAQEAVKRTGENRANATIEKNRLQRKFDNDLAKNQAKNADQATKSQQQIEKAIPSSTRQGPAYWDDTDYQRVRPYLEEHHVNTAEVGSTQQIYDALDNIQHGMERQIEPSLEKYAADQISSNPSSEVLNALGQNTSRIDFVDRGMRALAPYGDLDNMSVREAEGLRTQLNAENRSILSANRWDIATALRANPEFAARYYLQDSLRNGIYDLLEDRGVSGVREMRQDESSVIRMRNAAEKTVNRGDIRVRGTGAGKPGILDAVFGNRPAPDDLTRDQLIQQSMKFKTGEQPRRIVGQGTPPQPRQFGLSANDMRQIMRENSDLHSELASHYGEFAGDTSYADLERRFTEDINDKRAHGVTIDASEKKILQLMNKQDVAERTEAAQAAAEQQASGKVIGHYELPEKAEGLLQYPKNIPNGMNMQETIGHEIAHAIVGDEMGFSPNDGVRSHLHPKIMDGIASVPFDLSKLTDAEGAADPAKVAKNLSELMTSYVAGGVYNDLYHGVPFTESRGLSGDYGMMKKIAKLAGLSDLEASKAIAHAADRARTILSRPGMRDIIEGHAGVREAGLNEKYHISPDRMEQILEDVKNGTEREPNPGRTVQSGKGKNAGADGGDGAEGKEGLQGRAKAKRTKEPAKEPEGSVAGKEGSTEGATAGKSASAAEPKPNVLKGGINAGGYEASTRTPLQEQLVQSLRDTTNRIRENLGKGQGTPEERAQAEQRIKENEDLINQYQASLSVPPERTTGEHDQAIKAAGAIPGGVQKGFEFTDKAGKPATYPDTVLFHDPTSGTTLALKAPDVSEENVRKSLANSRAQYEAAKKLEPATMSVAGKKTDAIPEGSKFVQATAEEHRAALDKNPQGATLATESPEEMKNYKIFKMVTPEGKDTGIQYHITPNGEAGGLINNGPYKGATKVALDHATANGATHANSWDIGGALPGLYEKHGLVKTDAVPYDAKTYGPPSEQLKNAWKAAGWKEGDPYPSVQNYQFPKKSGSRMQNLISKVGTTNDTQMPAFIGPDGQRANVGAGTTHEIALAKAENLQSPVGQERINYLRDFINNEGAIRMRTRRTAAGDEAVFSVPGKVTPEQIAAMKNTVRDMGKNGSVYVEKAGPEVGYGFSGTGDEEVPSVRKDQVTENDIEPMLRELGAHPGGQSTQAPVVGEATGRQLATTQAENEAAAEAARRQQERDYNKYYTPGERFLGQAPFSPDRVSTRVPEGKNATENPLQGEPLSIGREAIQGSPKKLQDTFADKARKISGVKIPKGITDSAKVHDRFIRHVADNLKWLYSQVPEELRTAHAKWYESANKLANNFSTQFGKTYEPRQAAGVIASLSPQTEWDTNVSLAKRVMNIHANHMDEVVTPEMYAKGEKIIENSRKNPKAKAANAALERSLPNIAGKKLSDLTGVEQAMGVRLWDEVNNSRDFRRIDPATGNEMELRTKADGTPAAAGWGNFNNLAKALSILDDGSRENISRQVGDSHKVRNFYNNIIDPSHPDDVTIDTHAVGAGLLLPVSGNSPEVTANFGQGGSKATGVKGMYPLYAEGYRQAAKELGLKARELQSVTWEKIRDLFPAEWKTDDNMKAVKKTWKQYTDGKITIDKARQNILDMATQAKQEVEKIRADKAAKQQAKAEKRAQAEAVEPLAGKKMNANDFVSALKQYTSGLSGLAGGQ